MHDLYVKIDIMSSTYKMRQKILLKQIVRKLRNKVKSRRKPRKMEKEDPSTLVTKGSRKLHASSRESRKQLIEEEIELHEKNDSKELKKKIRGTNFPRPIR